MSFSTGTTRICESVSGGLIQAWLISADDMEQDGTSVTVAGGVVTTLTPKAGKVFQEFQFELDTAERRQTASLENGSLSILHEIEFFVKKLTTAQRNAIQEIYDESGCGIISVVKDANALQWLSGYSVKFTTLRPLRLLSGTELSGKAFTDLNGETVIIQSTDNTKDLEFTGTVPV